MRRLHLSIAGLMVLVGLSAVTFAAMRAERETWARVVLSLALATNGVALLGRLVARGAAKAAWTGYLVLGGGYLLLCVGPWTDEHVMPHLVATPLLDEQYETTGYRPTQVGEPVWVKHDFGRDYWPGQVFGPVAAETTDFHVELSPHGTSRYRPTDLRGISPDGHRRLGHATISLWTGLLGALLGRWLRGAEPPGAH